MEDTTTFDKELKRGTLEMILLRLISERQMYGYELAATLEKRGGSLFRLKEGWETLERGVPRKYYRLTKSGAKFLDARIAEWKEFIAAIERLMEKEKNP
jgi:PadR family transcriptional regulator PadR